MAIAGLLHDFYANDWQNNTKKRKLKEMHGFVHAKDAAQNAKKFFPELVDDKIYDMILTHMFPLNKRLPKYKESWILTFVDKVDSMEFLMHPYLMSTKFRKKLQDKMVEK